ncbi:MAG: tRNA (N6-isopentenyl adenosine(37)-C2)-methylthiotransferase MiaB [Azospirillaceae bacterium]|nr:tRNA (N6-isopentenyl adenosine(37)-C2)-methylthiotransferase MiaB [Azospirillaceae bacterium]
MSKTLFIKTWGCQMNAYDSARMADVLAPLGYRPTDSADGADMVILNTCHIREKAAEKVFSELGRLRELKSERADQGQRVILAVAGCVAQAEGAEIMARAPYVDIVFGPQTYHQLPEMVDRVTRPHGGRVIRTDFPPDSKFDSLPADTAGQGVTAFLSVQEGCDKFCTFCVVPYTRGAEFSRPATSIVAEAQRLVAAGAREITLLGQNVNAYHGEAPDGTSWGLGRLIRMLADIPELARLRYTTSHPCDMDDDLIAAHATVPQLMPFLHLPVQSGSNRVLAAMNRKHDSDDYRRIVERIRAARPDLALSSDFIVGFPDEQERDFEDTLRLVDEIGFAQAYSFKYSPRPGTPAAGMIRNQIPEQVKIERLAALQDLINRQQLAYNRSFIGRTVPVLFDRRGKRQGQIMGRTPFMQSVYVHAPDRGLATIAEVTITGAHANSLSGTLAGTAAAMTLPLVPARAAAMAVEVAS